MKMTLLEMVQDILNDMDSDEVNDIDDTIESSQVAQILKTVYANLATRRNWGFQKGLIQLEASGTTSRPTHMKLADSVKELTFIKYNKIKDGETRKRYLDVTYQEPDDFLRRINDRNNDNADVDVITDPTGVELLILNDKHPDYWTSFDDETIVFDSYDSAIESTLQKTNVQAMGVSSSTWTKSNTFIPDMPEEAFPGYLAEAKSVAFETLKQVMNQKAEQESVKQSRWQARKNWRAKGGLKYPNYGRKKSRTPSHPLDKTTVVTS